MLTPGEEGEAHAPRERGWMKTAIYDHLGRDGKTIRALLCGERVLGIRRRLVRDPLEPYAPCRIHFYAPGRIGKSGLENWAPIEVEDVHGSDISLTVR